MLLPLPVPFLRPHSSKRSSKGSGRYTRTGFAGGIASSANRPAVRLLCPFGVDVKPTYMGLLQGNALASDKPEIKR